MGKVMFLLESNKLMGVPRVTIEPNLRTCRLVLLSVKISRAPMHQENHRCDLQSSDYKPLKNKKRKGAWEFLCSQIYERLQFCIMLPGLVRGKPAPRRILSVAISAETELHPWPSKPGSSTAW